MANKKVLTFVFNNCANDARVLKESKSLADAGYDVEIYALLDKNTQEIEYREGFVIKRILRKPIHLRIIRRMNRVFKNPKKKIMNTGLRLSRKFFGLLGKLLSLVRPSAKSEEDLADKAGEKGVLTKVLDRIIFFFSSRHVAKIKKSPIRFLLYGWVLLVPYFLFRFIGKVVNAILRFGQNQIRTFLMRFHRPLSFFDYYKQVWGILKEHPAAIYHCNDLNTLPVGYFLKRRNGGVLIYDSHELYVERNRFKRASAPYRYLQKKMEGKMCRNCDGIITVGECIADYMADLYKVEKPLVVMNAPAKKKIEGAYEEIEIEDIRKVLNVKDEHKTLLYTGAITFSRGIENLILSLKHLPNYHLILLGYGAERYLKSLHEIAQEHKLDSRFSIYGPVPHQQVKEITKQVDLGVAPIQNVCLSYYYCAPNKVFEYLLGGIPVIGSDFPELKKIIEGFKIGGTFDPEDPKDIARSVNAIFADRDNYNAMKARTAEAAKNYNWETEAAKFVNLYNELSIHV